MMLWFLWVVAAEGATVPAVAPELATGVVDPAELREDITRLFRSTYQWKRDIDVEITPGLMFSAIDRPLANGASWFDHALRTLESLREISARKRARNILVARLNIILEHDGHFTTIPIDLGCFISTWSQNQSYKCNKERIETMQRLGYANAQPVANMKNGMSYIAYQQSLLQIIPQTQIEGRLQALITSTVARMQEKNLGNKLADSEHGLFACFEAYNLGSIAEKIQAIPLDKTGLKFAGCIIDVATFNETCPYCDIFYKIMLDTDKFKPLMTMIPQVLEIPLLHADRQPAFLVRIQSPVATKASKFETNPEGAAGEPRPLFLGQELAVSSRFTAMDDIKDGAINNLTQFFSPERRLVIKKLWYNDF